MEEGRAHRGGEREVLLLLSTELFFVSVAFLLSMVNLGHGLSRHGRALATPPWVSWGHRLYLAGKVCFVLLYVAAARVGVRRYRGKVHVFFFLSSSWMCVLGTRDSEVVRGLLAVKGA